MLFKSENYFLKISADLRLLLGLGFSALVGIGAVQNAHALAVTPALPWQLVNSTVYYQYYGGSGTAPVMDQDFAYFNFSENSAANTTSSPTILYFDVTAEKTFPAPTPSMTPDGTTSTPRLVVQAFSNRQNGGSASAVPIIYAGSPSSVTSCDSSICQKYDATRGFFYAARFTAGATSRIGINLQDICTELSVQNGGAPAFGCNADGSFKVPSTGNPTSFVLTFYVSYAPNDIELGTTDSSADSATRSLVAQYDIPSFTCPYLGTAYFPGDGEIELDTSVFSGSFVRPSGAASVVNLVVAGKKDGTPSVWYSFWAAGNEIVARFPYNSSKHPVTGFTNTTDGTDNVYALAFSAVDAAGTIASSSCSLPNVRTADIQGFLAKGNCFIATGAFRSTDAPPIVLLRQFRDQFLLSSAPGRAFVNWYYTWSPAKAEWLMKHPEFRFPVLQALLPLEIAAWLILHPTVAVVAMTGWFLMTVALMGLLCFGPGRRFL